MTPAQAAQIDAWGLIHSAGCESRALPLPRSCRHFAFRIAFKGQADEIASGARAVRRLIVLGKRAEAESLIDEQCCALAVYPMRHGRTCKARLRDESMRAAAAPELHRLRNIGGPAWLTRFRIPEAADA